MPIAYQAINATTSLNTIVVDSFTQRFNATIM